MESILQENKNHCFLCNGTSEPLDKHHIFNASNRDLSEKYGLFVYLCHYSCHIFGKNSVHKNNAVAYELKQKAEKEAMQRYGWSVEEFIKIFGRNYI